MTGRREEWREGREAYLPDAWLDEGLLGGGGDVAIRRKGHLLLPGKECGITQIVGLHDGRV